MTNGGSSIRVHYNNWGNRYDEVLPVKSPRVALLGTKFNPACSSYHQKGRATLFRTFFVDLGALDKGSELKGNTFFANAALMHALLRGVWGDMSLSTGDADDTLSKIQVSTLEVGHTNFFETSHVNISVLVTKRYQAYRVEGFAVRGYNATCCFVAVLEDGFGVALMRCSQIRCFY